MDTQGSRLLDKVIESKQNKQLRELQPLDIIDELFSGLSEKERDILVRRFALRHDRNRKESLESIGQSYDLTRERIRQIEADAVRKIKQSEQLVDFLQHIEATMTALLEEHGGAMEEEHLFERLLEVAGDTAAHRQSLLFIMDKLSPKYEAIRREDPWMTGWRLSVAQLERMREVLDVVMDVVKKEDRPLSFDEIHDQIKGHEVYAKHAVTEKMLLAILKLAKDVGENPYGEFGLADWSEITPRRMGDKIYIVLKKHGQPLHFTEIAEHINKVGFDKKKALPQTVHNELIVDDRFVLIGRGIYALREWGYEPGIVAEVIAKVLDEAGKPLTKEEIIDRVLKHRLVKRATVYIALINKNNESRFKRLPDGRYELAQ